MRALIAAAALLLVAGCGQRPKPVAEAANDTEAALLNRAAEIDAAANADANNAAAAAMAEANAQASTLGNQAGNAQ